MITNSNFIILIILLSFLACKDENEMWKVPVGYQNHRISLGDDFKDIKDKIGNIELDANAENSNDFNNYINIPDAVVINNLKINPIIFMRFNRSKLVRFEIVYTIDETENMIDYQRIIEKLGKRELTQIKKLLKKKRKSIANNRELWLRRIDIDTITGEYPKIHYRVQAIP